MFASGWDEKSRRSDEWRIPGLARTPWLSILKGPRKNQEGGSLGDSRTFPDRVLKPFAQAFEIGSIKIWGR